jgi:hypothetical protein
MIAVVFWAGELLAGSSTRAATTPGRALAVIIVIIKPKLVRQVKLAIKLDVVESS